MTEKSSTIEDLVEEASRVVGEVWPLYSFVTSNPLSGFEDRPFKEAVEAAEGLIGGHGYPTADQFRQAWESDRIDPDVLRQRLDEHDLDLNPEDALRFLESEEPEDYKRNRGARERNLDQLLVKWLGAFLDEGQTTWAMPGREKGFYAAWKELARMDYNIPEAGELGDLPGDREQAVTEVLEPFPRDRWASILTHHLTALPGWTGYIKQRNNRDNDPWREEYPIDLVDYLAVRLVLADHLGTELAPGEDDQLPRRHDHGLRDAWLNAWEETYRRRLLDRLVEAAAGKRKKDDDRPDAQMVFCIDTRSEIIRRHIEATGDYETHGYAGFFGVPIRYQGYGEEIGVDACPPPVDAEHAITDRPREDREDQMRARDDWEELTHGVSGMVKSLKSNVLAAFNFVEGAGSFYGIGLLARTLFPNAVRKMREGVRDRVPGQEEFTVPDLEGRSSGTSGEELPAGMEFEEMVSYAESAFDLMGWENFAPLVVFTGHASETSNNPFDSSLDCGACAGNPGGPNARVLARICNNSDVREALADRGFEIPGDTLFLAGEHNTTTDEIELYTQDLPEEYEEKVDTLRGDLTSARDRASSERMRTLDDQFEGGGSKEARERASDWAQTRPEWGLAGNAGLIVGPRWLTGDLDLGGRVFLHSYDWSQDPDADALRNIFSGPVVVSQWINNQYYFSTVSTGVFGSGSKVTQNPVGNFGVLQGNGGDLMTGLPLQSLKATDVQLYHQPIRLTTVVHAPRGRISDVLDELDHPRTLIENHWMSLAALDPEEGNRAFTYRGGEWIPHREIASNRPEEKTVTRGS